MIIIIFTCWNQFRRVDSLILPISSFPILIVLYSFFGIWASFGTLMVYTSEYRLFHRCDHSEDEIGIINWNISYRSDINILASPLLHPVDGSSYLKYITLQTKWDIKSMKYSILVGELQHEVWPFTGKYAHVDFLCIAASDFFSILLTANEAVT